MRMLIQLMLPSCVVTQGFSQQGLWALFRYKLWKMTHNDNQTFYVQKFLKISIASRLVDIFT